MINPNKNLWIWGPIDGRLIYVSYFMIAIQGPLPRLYKYPWSESFFYFIKDKMTFVSDEEEIRESGKKHFKTWILNDKNFERVKADYQKALTDLRNIQSGISKDFLSLLNDGDLFNLYSHWQELYLSFWGVGLVLELANLGGEKILKQSISNKVDNQKTFFSVMEKLSAPERLSFYQEEELDLLKIKNIQKKKKINHLLEKHAGKYFWIRNSYFEQKQLGTDYFRQALNGIKRQKEKIKEIKNLPQKRIDEKRLIIREYKFNKEIVKISQRLSYSIWWQDSRKKEIFIANHYIDLFLKEISKRKRIKFFDLKFYWPAELIGLL
jgi:hypothetical protein